MSKRTRPSAGRGKQIRERQVTRQRGTNFCTAQRVTVAESPNERWPTFPTLGDLRLFFEEEDGLYLQNLTVERSTDKVDRPVGSKGLAQQVSADAIKSRQARDSIETEFYRQAGVPVHHLAMTDV